MNGPRRLLEQPGPSARLLRAAEIHVPSERARRRALLAAGSAAATLAASGSSAAVGGAALVKSALVWLSAGVLGGAVIAVVATKALPTKTPLEHRSAVATAVVRPPALGPRGPAVVPRASSPSIGRIEPASLDQSGARAPAGLQPRLEPAPRAAPTTADTARVALSAPSVLRFANDAPSGPNLYDELRLIDGARNAAAHRDGPAVLALLDRYDGAYPHGQFIPESLALRIETLARAGDRSQARALAARFRRDYPQHPLLGRVGAAVGD